MTDQWRRDLTRAHHVCEAGIHVYQSTLRRCYRNWYGAHAAVSDSPLLVSSADYAGGLMTNRSPA